MSRSEAGAGASKRVSLEQVSMPRLMFALLRQRFTGTMVLPQPAPQVGTRTVWFRGGMPVFTDWAAPSEVLGQVLQALRLIDEEQLLQALEAMAASGGLLGEHLLAQEILDRPRLLEGLRQQCTRKLAQLFGLRSGEVTVVVGDGGGVDADLLPLNVLELILAAVGVTYDEVRVESEMGAALRGQLQTSGALTRYQSHFGFRSADEAILRALESGSTLDQLTSLPGIGVRRAAQVIYTLWACQMLRTGAEASSSPSAPAPRAAAPTPAPAARVVQPTPAPSGRVLAPTPAAARRTLEDLSASEAKPAAAEAKPAASEAKPAAEDGFDGQLEALEAKISAGAHAFELFGLPLTATKRDVRRAWGDLSRMFHPDALKSQGREHLHDRVSHVFAALSEAQQLLGDAEQRDKLREAIENGEHQASSDGRDATAKAHAVFQSELVAKEADKLLRAHRFDRALERYREAARYDAEEPDLVAAIAWCEYQLSDKTPADADRIKARLAEVIEQAPRLARAQYFMGFVLADKGRNHAAVEAFRRAAKLDSRLIDAERQARAIELRAGRSPAPTSGAKGLREGLKGLFGGKK